MAKKPTQADLAAAAAKPKKPKQPAKNTSKKGQKGKAAKSPKVRTEYENAIPAKTIMAFICFILFALFLVICFKPDGKLLILLRNVFYGLIGRAGFYFSIPALFYLFIINAFGKRIRVGLRSNCTIAFVFFCGQELVFTNVHNTQKYLKKS